MSLRFSVLIIKTRLLLFQEISIHQVFFSLSLILCYFFSLSLFFTDKIFRGIVCIQIHAMERPMWQNVGERSESDYFFKLIIILMVYFSSQFIKYVPINLCIIFFLFYIKKNYIELFIFALRFLHTLEQFGNFFFRWKRNKNNIVIFIN